LKKTALSCLFILISLSVSAQEFFAGEFWAPYAVITPEFDVKPPDAEELIDQLLDEMRFVFGGMIYGFSFTYVPSDIERSVEEFFELDPLGEIRPGDRNMAVYQTRTDRTAVYAMTKYDLDEYQKNWVLYWNSEAFPTIDGRGRDMFIKGVSAKIEAIRQAIKEAVRAYLRKRIFNKPKKITGYVRIDEVPYIVIESGDYLAKVRVTMDIHEIEEYKTF